MNWTMITRAVPQRRSLNANAIEGAPMVMLIWLGAIWLLALILLLLELTVFKRRDPYALWQGTGMLLLLSGVGGNQVAEHRGWPYHHLGLLRPLETPLVVIGFALFCIGLTLKLRTRTRSNA
jgi:hypothetical protein